MILRYKSHLFVTQSSIRHHRRKIARDCERTLSLNSDDDNHAHSITTGDLIIFRDIVVMHINVRVSIAVPLKWCGGPPTTTARVIRQITSDLSGVLKLTALESRRILTTHNQACYIHIYPFLRGLNYAVTAHRIRSVEGEETCCNFRIMVKRFATFFVSDIVDTLSYDFNIFIAFISVMLPACRNFEKISPWYVNYYYCKLRHCKHGYFVCESISIHRNFSKFKRYIIHTPIILFILSFFSKMKYKCLF